jgi:hypothetical protein
VDRYSIYCPDTGQFTGPWTLQEAAEVLANIARLCHCKEPHIVAPVEDYES